MIDVSSRVGPAFVTIPEGRPGAVEIAMPDGERLWARLALAVPYRPAEGDEVLVIRGDEGAYVIGLLAGRGDITLRAPGALTIEAGRGLLLKSASCVETAAPQVTIRAGRFDTIAHRIVQKARDFYGWISELFHLDTERLKATAQSDLELHGERARIQAKDTVTVDGQSIHLG